MNYLGLSYGAHLGSAYAEPYPKRIRTMALDAIANRPSSTACRRHVRRAAA